MAVGRWGVRRTSALRVHLTKGRTLTPNRCRGSAPTRPNGDAGRARRQTLHKPPLKVRMQRIHSSSRTSMTPNPEKRTRILTLTQSPNSHQQGRYSCTQPRAQAAYSLPSRSSLNGIRTSSSGNHRTVPSAPLLRRIATTHTCSYGGRPSCHDSPATASGHSPCETKKTSQPRTERKGREIGDVPAQQRDTARARGARGGGPT